MHDLDPKELEIKLKAYYNEWDKTFSYYVEFKSNQLTMPNGVKVRHESSWRIEKFGYPSLTSTPVFHVWDQSHISEYDYRVMIDALAVLAEHVFGNKDRRSAARQELIGKKVTELNEKIAKLERELNELPDF